MKMKYVNRNLTYDVQTYENKLKSQKQTFLINYYTNWSLTICAVAYKRCKLDILREKSRTNSSRE